MSWPFGDMPAGAYDLIMSDNPWRFRTFSDKGLKKSAQAHYSCMGIEDIYSLPVGELAAPDCLLWLWATWPMLPEGMQTLSRWGFQFKTGGVWAKRTKTGKLRWGTGFRLRSVCEPFLIGVKGKPKSSRDVANMVDGLAREHSRKPDEAYRAAERLMPNARRADIFARERRPGWDAWGNEADKFDHPPARPAEDYGTYSLFAE